jgi:hypothetical protein
MYYWWNDANADRKMDLTEMYWHPSSRYRTANDPLYEAGDPARYVPYQVFNADGTLTTMAFDLLHDQPNTAYNNQDAYFSGNLTGFDWYNPVNIDYERGVTSYFNTRADQNSARTREIMLTLEREILPDFSAQINLSYRKFDHDRDGYRYYAAEHAVDYASFYGGTVVDPDGAGPLPAEYVGPDPYDLYLDPTTINENGWYVEAGTIPDTFYIGGRFEEDEVTGNYVWSVNEYDPDTNPTGYLPGDPRYGTQYDTGGAAGRPYYLPGAGYPTISSRYTLYMRNDDYFTYRGLDLVLNKRLSHKWMMNASLTLQAQRTYWGNDLIDPTNQWAFDGKAYGDWGGAASGKTSVLMYTRWMVKVSGLYQLPYGFNISGTVNAREGWSVPHYFTLFDYDAPNYTADHDVTIYTQPQTDDALPTFYNISLRLEKKVNIGAGRLYLMADVFNLLNSNMPIRSYSEEYGTAYYNVAGTLGWQQTSQAHYNFTGLRNEILNPRVIRFGARFEF